MKECSDYSCLSDITNSQIDMSTKMKQLQKEIKILKKEVSLRDDKITHLQSQNENLVSANMDMQNTMTFQIRELSGKANPLVEIYIVTCLFS